MSCRMNAYDIYPDPNAKDKIAHGADYEACRIK